MLAGDLVKKRWGRLDPHQQGTIAVCLDPNASETGLLLTGNLVKVIYPGRTPELHRSSEFEVISESR